MINIHPARLFQLNEQGKGALLRQTKHFEETSELAEAVVCQHAPEKILSEAIDGLLMLLSIGADYCTVEEFSDSMPRIVDTLMYKHWNEWQPLVDNINPLELALATLQYISTLQYITTAVQRHEGVASSQYKGLADSQSIIDGVITSIDNLFLVMVLVPQDEGLLQQIYNEKMDKWEKVSK